VSEAIQFVGLDVHAAQTAVAAVELGSGVVRQQRIAGPPVAAVAWLAALPGAVRAVYEAGPTGFGLARAARELGIEMMVCSPGAIPRQPGDRVKTDARDALKLARPHAAGQLRPVVVPSRELEGLRDLVRCREDLRGDLMRCRHRISKLLLRRDHVWTGPGNTWTHAHLRWLSTVQFNDALVDTVLGEHLAHHEALLARRDRLDGLLVDQAQQGEQAALIARLRCLRGIDTLTAIGLVAEIGDFAHFAHPRRLASYLGMTPIRALLGRAAPTGCDHQGRVQPRPTAAGRGGLALPSPTTRLADAATPPSRAAGRRHRRGLARADAAAPPLEAPRRAPRQETHHRRGRGRPRALVLCLGDRAAARLIHRHDNPFGRGWRPARATGIRDRVMSTAETRRRARC
jgi:transposase